MGVMKEIEMLISNSETIIENNNTTSGQLTVVRNKLKRTLYVLNKQKLENFDNLDVSRKIEEKVSKIQALIEKIKRIKQNFNNEIEK